MEIRIHTLKEVMNDQYGDSMVISAVSPRMSSLLPLLGLCGQLSIRLGPLFGVGDIPAGSLGIAFFAGAFVDLFDPTRCLGRCFQRRHLQ